MRLWHVFAAVALAAALPAQAADAPAGTGGGSSGFAVDGWRDFKFGMTRDEVMEQLHGTGAIYAGAVRSTAELGGATYDVLMKFKDNRLHEVFLKSGLGYSRLQTDQQCLADHMARVRDLETVYNVRAETDASSIGGSVRYVFARSRLSFANGARISVEGKFVPSLDGNGLCESTLFYQDAN